MLLFLSVTGIVLSIILLYFNYRKFNSSIYLGSFFFLISIYGFIAYSLIYSKSIILAGVFYVNFTFLTYLIGPMLFWYIRSVLKDDSKLNMRDLWHLVPPVVFLITSIPYSFTSWPEKMKIAGEIVNQVGFLAMYKPTILYHFLPNVLIHLSRPLLVLIYVSWSALIFIKYLADNKERDVFINQRYMVKWLVMFLGSAFVLSISQILMLAEAYTEQDSKLFFTVNLLQVISVGGLAGLLITPFFFPQVLYGLPRFPGIILQEKTLASGVYLSHETEKKRLPVLESNYIELISNKLDQCMASHQLYLRVDCNMVNTSNLLGFPVHHMAYYFRGVKKQSFNDYRNELRVKHAKQLIREGKARELSLEGIALQSGFSTRNTFFTAFKKIEGETPSAFSAKFSG